MGNDSPFLRAPLLSPTSSLLTGRRLDFHQLADYHARRTTISLPLHSVSLKFSSLRMFCFYIKKLATLREVLLANLWDSGKIDRVISERTSSIV